MTQAQDQQLSFFKIAQLVELFLIYFYVANHLRTKQELHFFYNCPDGGDVSGKRTHDFAMAYWAGVSQLQVLMQHTLQVQVAQAGTLGPATVAGGIIAAHLMIIIAMIWIFREKIAKSICSRLFCDGVYCLLIGTASPAAWSQYNCGDF